VIVFVFVLAALLAQNASTIFSASIESTLRDSFQQSELVNYEIRQGTPLQVFATIRMPAGTIPDTSEIVAAQENLVDALGEPVELSVIIQPVVEASVARADAEVEALIEQTLDEQLTDMNVLGFVFDVGNPTLVLAVVQTDLGPSSEAFDEQTRAAEAALTQALGLPVALNILTVASYDSGSAEAVDATDKALTEVIEEILVESLTCCEVLTFSFQVGNPFLVTVSVTTDMDPASDEFLAQVQATETALAIALGWPVKLTVIVAQPTPTPTETLIPILPTLTPTPEPTIEPPTPEPTQEPPTPEPTIELPTVEPPTPEPTVEPPTPQPTAGPSPEPTTGPVPSPTP